jgi:formate-nitrite transporter family protein
MTSLAIPLSVHDHVRGRVDATLTLIQYGDFQCPHCARMYPMVLEIADDLGDSVAFALRHFPLSQAHPLAQLTAEAAEAAASQDRFWEMATVLYENQEEIDDDRLTRYAQKADLDIKRFKKEIKSGIHASRVRADYLGGVRSGVKGTPTFFINGQLYEGEHEFGALVAELLKASRGR